MASWYTLTNSATTHFLRKPKCALNPGDSVVPGFPVQADTLTAAYHDRLSRLHFSPTIETHLTVTCSAYPQGGRVKLMGRKHSYIYLSVFSIKMLFILALRCGDSGVRCDFRSTTTKFKKLSWTRSKYHQCNVHVEIHFKLYLKLNLYCDNYDYFFTVA